METPILGTTQSRLKPAFVSALPELSSTQSGNSMIPGSAVF